MHAVVDGFIDEPTGGCRRAAVRLAAAALLIGGSLPGFAAELVIFRDTRSLKVDAVVEQGGRFLLDMGGGNRVEVPASEILEIKTLEFDPVESDAASAWRREAGPYERFIEAAARQHGIDPELLVAVALVESALDPAARSAKGALGLMQIMPTTAEDLGLADPFDARQNIEAGARFLREMLDLFEGDLDLALAAYNAGQGAVRRYGGVPPFSETREYLSKVRGLVERLRRGRPPDA